MRVRSTGLGKTELLQEVSKIYRKDDHLVMEIRTTSPVKWHIRTAITYKDLLMLIKAGFRPSVLWWLVSGFTRANNPRPITDY